MVRIELNKALLADKFSAALQICRRARRYEGVSLKRDMEIVRKISISLADKGVSDPLKELDPEILQYHLWIMQEAGLIDCFSRHGPEGGVAMHSQELTWAGNEFLEAARSDTVWNKAQKLVLEKTGATSFEVIKAVLIDIALKAV